MLAFLERWKKILDRRFRTPPIKIIRVKFLGWGNEETRKKFFGAVDLYEQELQTGRVQPKTPPYLFYMKGVKYVSGVGTPPGSELEFFFDPEKLSEERIREYLKEIELNVDEKSWRVVKDKPGNWFFTAG